ncbi:hypothetical protein LY78DRAFT_617393 [Colletotrichum sublineola]|nr:hypothetical protein LY78DRAFT_617393 [Colletotrichum sublineola]
MLPPLSNLMQHAFPEMMPIEDNWKGKTSPAERRKIQNKLNQRTWKAHNAEPPSSYSPSLTGVLVPVSRGAAEPPAFVAQDHTEMHLSRPGLPRKAKEPYVCALKVTLAALTYLGRSRPMIELREEDLDDLHDLFLQRAYESRGGRSSGADSSAGAGADPLANSLLSLVQFNLFRGLMENSKTLGITLSMILDDDCVSPYSSNPAYDGTERAAALPSSLRPTRMQLTAAHHPWLDIFPLPRLRDNLIEAGSALDDDELCLDMLGSGDAPSGQGGMILWGEPWDPRSWEVTEDFVKKWRWVLKGCGELIVSSNYWRAKRGEVKMKVKL